MRLLVAMALMLVPFGLCAEGREHIGSARLFSNDRMGDAKDRWRTGAYQYSRLYGPAWDGALPGAPGAMLEYRLRTEIFAPSDISGPGPDDRPYAGVITAGVHTHWQPDDLELSAGAELVVVGPSTGLGNFHKSVHHILGQNPVNTLGRQMGDRAHLAGRFEAGRRFAFGQSALLRPFVEAQAGPETLARVGADFMLGQVARTDMMVRDQTTGHLVRATKSAVQGAAFVAGADWSYVDSSAWLPGGKHLSDRWRARMGVHWQPSEGTSLFYGASYLSPEFQGQPEGQVLGSVSINFKF